jgi:mRNA interferase RelE/StbE
VKTAFQSSFAKDLRAIKSQDLRSRVAALIEAVEAATSMSTFPNLKKLRAAGGFYRVRVGEYRVGLVIRRDVVTFVRCLHRREIYRFFP